ncbi:hypothetical protein JCM19238_486 [Vibrio ponticus]|nr:hypothetical protein JCM19238_486 [Vibrio ponticus]
MRHILSQCLYLFTKYGRQMENSSSQTKTPRINVVFSLAKVQAKVFRVR